MMPEHPKKESVRHPRRAWCSLWKKCADPQYSGICYRTTYPGFWIGRCFINSFYVYCYSMLTIAYFKLHDLHNCLLPEIVISGCHATNYPAFRGMKYVTSGYFECLLEMLCRYAEEMQANPANQSLVLTSASSILRKHRALFIEIGRSTYEPARNIVIQYITSRGRSPVSMNSCSANSRRDKFESGIWPVGSKLASTARFLISGVIEPFFFRACPAPGRVKCFFFHMVFFLVKYFKWITTQ